MDLNNELYDEIKLFCKLNGISDIDKEIESYIRIGFNIKKYGSSPFEKMKQQSSNKEDITADNTKHVLVKKVRDIKSK